MARRTLVSFATAILIVVTLASKPAPADCTCAFVTPYDYWCEGGDPTECTFGTGSFCSGVGNCQACWYGYGQCCDTVYTLANSGNSCGSFSKEMRRRSTEFWAQVMVPDCTGALMPFDTRSLSKEAGANVRKRS